MVRFLAPLLWKSWCIRKRHYIYTILELGLPVGLFYLLIYMKTSLPDNHNSVVVNNTTYPPISKDELLKFPRENNYDNIVIAYTPINDGTEGIISSVYKKLIAAKYTVDLVPSSNETEMRQYFFDNYANDTHFYLVYGVIFYSNFSYSLRPVSMSLSTDTIFPIFASPGPGNSFWSYFNQGYLMLQVLINDEIFQSNKLYGVGGNPLEFSLTEFPYPSYNNVENFKNMFTMLIPLLTIFGYYVISPNLISNVIQEKNSGSREWIGMVGISKIMVLFGWVLHSMIIYLFTTLANSIILQVNIDGSPILASTNFFVVWILLFLFCTSSVLFLMAATSFINNPNVAVICASILWILPPVAVSNYENAKNLGFVAKIFTCFFPSVNLNWAFTAISGYEANHESITFSNLFRMNNGNSSDISLGLSFVFMVIDIILYCIVYLYIDSIKPGRYGRARPWYFPFKQLMKLFNGKNGDDYPVGRRRTLVNFEEVKDDRLVGLSLQGIKKHFGSVIAVEDVTIDIYKGQITALLGHNGAGKTTLINIITGMFSPTCGRISKSGSNVFEDFKKFQANLGLCPQHDLLFPYLNVYEHAMFFGMLRGLSAKKAAQEATELLSFFGISDKKNSLTKQLSGGMKRKLSLTIALIGNPEIIILDEPTSGMDPESRRETWNKLLFLRENRTIILTTHYMEEADVLGDMIAIMDHGVIKCYGTSLYLKKQYGSGYKVTVPCDNHEDISKVVQSFVPDNIVSTRTDSTISYCLPLEKTNVFGDLFLALEDKLLGCRISVACTTMDDVFLKVAHGGADEIDNIPMNGDDEMLLQESYKNDDMHSSSEALTPKPITGLSLFIKRLSALFMKKILYNYHRWSSLLFLTVLYPFIILLIPLLLTSTILNGEFTDPSLAMDLNLYGNTKVLLSFSNSGNSLIDSFINLVKEQGSSIHQLPDSMTVEQALLDVGTENLVEYRYSYIVSANLSSQVPNIFFSSIGTHSAPIAINLLYNAFCHNCTSQIITYNHPFNFHENICDSRSMVIAAVPPMIWLFTVPTVLAVISYSMGRLHHDERLSSGKLLQLMTGTSPILYWVSAFLCDFILFFVSSLLILLYVFIFDSAKLFASPSDYGIMLLVFLLSCTSSTWLGYLMSYFLRTFSRLFSFNIFLALILGEVAFFILQVLHLGNPTALDAFNNIFLVYPSYGSSSLIYKVIKYFSENAIILKCHHTIGPDMKNALFTWKDSGINKELVVLVCDAMIYAFLIFLTDYGIIGKIWNYIFNLYAGNIDRSNTITDADVDNEKIRVEQEFMSINGNSSNVIVHKLGKKYSRKLTAVRDVSFLVNKGECFGLLGVNGAGKSTTFKMLTGDLMPTSGVAYIFGDSLKDNKLRYQSHIGYCPQSDAIIEDLTGYEMLSLYASLRGVNPSIRNQTISYWISKFGLQTVCNRKCETYSGGNKRKLSTAISLIGDPQIILLDEPTTGVDPVARRKFWAVLSKLQKKGSTIILTSHSMDECETVCNRLTIMVRGEMKCIGTIERLKDIYGQGFTILIQLKQHSEEDLINLKSKFMESFHPHAVLRDEHTGLLHYHINCPDYKWSQLFSKMESLKASYDMIKEYLITETSLEQIFLYFAKT